MSVCEGDIRDADFLRKSCRGASIVFHVASIIDVNDSVEYHEIYGVNVKGTQLLLEACVQENVVSFIYTSTIEVMGPNSKGDPIINGSEDMEYSCALKFAYSRTKQEAEQRTLQAHGEMLHNGGRLATCALRPMYIYGEGCRFLLGHMGDGIKNKNVLYRMSKPEAKVNPVYVGNVATAHLQAARSLKDPQKRNAIGGKFYFISDDTPHMSYSDFNYVVMSPLGFNIQEKLMFPLRLLYLVCFLMEMLCLMVRPVVRIVPPLNRQLVTMLNTPFSFSYQKAKDDLGYSPRFTWEEARQRTSDDECADLNNYTFLEYRQQRGKVQVQYLLLTRRNMDCAERFRHESLSETQQPPTNFNISRPTKVIIHGFRITGSRPTWVRLLARTLLEAQDVNVLVVDWVYCASFAYNQVVENYKEAALQISVLINQLQEHGCKLQSFHFIGISLGAHVAGLDVAGPLFKGADIYDRLDPSDALFVEAIHTDSDLFGYVLCDHMRAIYVYMSALNGSCPLLGVPCFSYEDFLQGRCLTCDAFNGKCPTIGLLENSGISITPLPKEQKLFLLTTSSSPFCSDRKGTTVYSVVLSHPFALCEINSMKIKNTGNRFYRQGDIHVKSVCLSEIPSQSREEPLCVNNIDIRRGAPWSHDFVQVCGSS
ncbi:hypothetical protein F7725_002350 [Dissostichus mawsoni]|uniref:Phospholipase A1 member A n=1 Tax=Dissostichus mawsoni TaxID=36200 RepID=A0A7J5Y3B2_DISMA|nr:hypothetical protein F7725_002350 [Dissostichus mawsoni]